MTDDKEKILSKKKNFKHSFKAVHISRLELLLRLSNDLDVVAHELYSTNLNQIQSTNLTV
jgi:hypothetical protein